MGQQQLEVMTGIHGSLALSTLGLNPLYFLNQESTTFFCKVSGSKYFRLCEPFGLP